MLNQQSKYSPVNQTRYQKQNDNIGFSTFQASTQMNKRQLAEFRKEVRYTILNREPFIENQQKSNLYLGNWGKHEKPILNHQVKQEYQQIRFLED